MISVVVLAKNEEKNIKACLETLSWCDEILIIDDGSSDNTKNIAEKNKAKVCQHFVNNDFSEQRNFGLTKAIGDWVMYVDADERASIELRDEILKKINDSGNKFNGFYIKRKDIIWDKELKYGETGNIKLLRLAKKGYGEWVGNVHEEWIIKGNIGQLENYLIHYPHKNITEFLQKINLYTSIRSSELFIKKYKLEPLSVIYYPVAKFIFNYFFKLGFMDGISGLILAIVMSFHSFLVRAKLWFLYNKGK